MPLRDFYSPYSVACLASFIFLWITSQSVIFDYYVKTGCLLLYHIIATEVEYQAVPVCSVIIRL